jgi:hypothetical protein
VLLNYLIELIIFQQLVTLEEFNPPLVELSQILKQEICMQHTLEEFVLVKHLKAQTVVW